MNNTVLQQHGTNSCHKCGNAAVFLAGWKHLSSRAVPCLRDSFILIAGVTVFFSSCEGVPCLSKCSLRVLVRPRRPFPPVNCDRERAGLRRQSSKRATCERLLRRCWRSQKTEALVRSGAAILKRSTVLRGFPETHCACFKTFKQSSESEPPAQ